MANVLSSLDAITTARSIFYLLLPLVLFGPKRYALVAWLVTTNLDLTGPAGLAAPGVGWLNATKTLILPLLLGYRFRTATSTFWRRLPSISWILLVGYAGLASLWSPYPLAAAKIVANMAGILLAVVVLEKAAREGLLSDSSIAIFALLTLLVGAGQTAFFGGEAFGFDGPSRPPRFTAFVSAQQYAAVLVALFSAVLWVKTLSGWRRLGLLVLLAGAMHLNGSRTWFVGGITVLIGFGWFHSRRFFGHVTLCLAGVVLAVLVLVNVGFLTPERMLESDSRIFVTLGKLADGVDALGQSGLHNLHFRVEMYTGLFEELEKADLQEILLGHGTSSGVTVAQSVFPRAYSFNHLDPNRSVHNEWLRCLYEWGVVGMLLWCTTLASLVVGIRSMLQGGRSKTTSGAVVCYLPALFLALSTENILAGAGNAVTIGFSVLLGRLAASDEGISVVEYVRKAISGRLTYREQEG